MIVIVQGGRGGLVDVLLTSNNTLAIIISSVYSVVATPQPDPDQAALSHLILAMGGDSSLDHSRTEWGWRRLGLLLMFNGHKYN